MKLTRSSSDKVLFGVCGGLSEYFGVDVTLIRIGLALSTFFAFGSLFIVYILAALVMPVEDKYYS
jgi:phage shock protein PspC (stress-responsive transcriptional regulator)